jgi:hypothetical protein
MQMQFDRLNKLGPEKFQRISNELMRGTPTVLVARLIQEWGDAQNVGEETLAKQLKRLHTAIENGAFGGALAEEARRKASVKIKLLHGSTVNCMNQLIEIADIQRARVLALWDKERISNKRNFGLNTAIRDYRNLLIAIQKIKFDLGLDEYRRSFPVVRAPQASPPRPDSAALAQREREAAEMVEEIFKTRAMAGEVKERVA